LAEVSSFLDMFVSIPLKDTIANEYLDRILTALARNGMEKVKNLTLR
jgi:hypothetical protein